MAEIKILIVTGDRKLLSLFERHLSTYNLTLLESSFKAVYTVCGEKFDIYIIDCHIPGLNGIEILKTIKGEREGENYIGILCIEEGTAGHLKDEITSGLITYFIEKPVDVPELKSIVKKAAARLKKREENHA